MDLPMAQLPNFGVSQPGIPYQGNMGAGAAAGLPIGINSIAQIAQIQQQRQQLQMEKQQQTISQVDTLLKNGINLPGLLPTFWPAIASRMNSLSPDYKLDPNNPPPNLIPFSKALSDISDGVQGGVVNMQQAHAATVNLIKTSFPSAQEALGNPTTGTSSQSGQPMTQTPQLSSPSQGQQPPQGQPTGAQDPLQNFLGLKDKYDKSNALISQAPLSQQESLRQQLANSSLGLDYKKSLDQLATTANQQYTEGQQNYRNQMNQNNDMIKAGVTNFQSQGKEFNNVADNFSAFNHLMQLAGSTEGQGTDTTATVQAEKTALLNYAQMAYPGTGRPGNMQMLETMEKSGPLETLIGQYLNRLDKGDIMTSTQIKGLRQAALALYQGRETQHSQLENSYSKNLGQYGGNPQTLLGNMRPQSVVSTSPLYQTQSSDLDPLIGHVRVKNGKSYTYLGGDKTNPNNWAEGNSGG